MPLRNLIQDCRTTHMHAGTVKRGLRTRQVLYELESRLASKESWDTDPKLCGLPDDRVLMLDSGTIRNATKDDRITRRLKVMSENGTPTRWFQYLRETVPEHDADAVMDWLQVWVGYTLTGYVREHKFVFLSGGGGCGKGTFIETVAAVLGDYATAIPADGLIGNRSQHRQWMALCDGPRMAHFTETSPGVEWKLADLKDLTGGGTVSANRMRSNSYTFLPSTKLIIAGNDRPVLPRVDTAIERRLILIVFDRKPQRVDEKLPDKLKTEYGRILSWAIEGARIYLQRGLPDLPPSVQESTSGYLTDEDWFARFLEDCFLRNASGRVSNAILKTVFNGWQRESGGQQGCAWDITWITRELKKRGFQSYRASKERGIAGLQQRPGLPVGW